MRIGLGTVKEPKELRPRVFIVGGFFLLGLLVLAVNLYRLMVVRYEEFLALSVDNVGAVQAELEKAGIAITGGPITFPGGATSIFVRDPDRNVIEFNQEPS